MDSYHSRYSLSKHVSICHRNGRDVEQQEEDNDANSEVFLALICSNLRSILLAVSLRENTPAYIYLLDAQVTTKQKSETNLHSYMFSLCQESNLGFLVLSCGETTFFFFFFFLKSLRLFLIIL
jgi:hypothetical protein